MGPRKKSASGSMMVHTWTRINELSKYRNALSSGYTVTIFARETVPLASLLTPLMAESTKFPSPPTHPNPNQPATHPHRKASDLVRTPYRGERTGMWRKSRERERGVLLVASSARNLSGKYYSKSDSPFARGSPTNSTATNAVHGVVNHPFRHATPCILKHKHSRIFHNLYTFFFFFFWRGKGANKYRHNWDHSLKKGIVSWIYTKYII